MLTPSRHGALGRVAFTLALTVSVVGTGAQENQELQRAVEQALEGERDTRDIRVSVEGREVTLTGRVESFWVKRQALRRTSELTGVDTVISELEIPLVESDEELSEDVVRAVQRYASATLWDYIGVVVKEGTVTLSGWVTPQRDKAGEIFERVSKVRGVQDVRSVIETLPASQQDARLRRAVSRRLFANWHFERFATLSNPPFRVIVKNSVVTLLGYLQGDIERTTMEQIVADTQGVLRVDNRIQTLR